MRAAILIYMPRVYFCDEMGLFHVLNFSTSRARNVVISIIYVGFRCDEAHRPSGNYGDLSGLASLSCDVSPERRVCQKATKL